MDKEKHIIKTIGNKIKFYRTKCALSQEKLAEMSGLHTTYIGQLERGEKNPSIITLYKLTDALGIALYDLIPIVSDSGKKSTLPADRAYEIMISQKEENQQKLLDIIKIVADYK